MKNEKITNGAGAEIVRGVSISRGNVKLGAIPSVSLPACITCNPAAPCFKKCYARRMSARRATVRDAYAKNLEIYQNGYYNYFGQISNAVKTTRFFRWHVSGDIPDAEYLAGMAAVAQANPHCTFLAFTKQYQIVNRYISKNFNFGKPFPDNLKIIFSNWGAWKCENPYKLPQCEIIFKGEQPADDWKICGGNCTDCACRGVGCWELKNGETIAIYEH